jgi:hypothetical protein
MRAAFLIAAFLSIAIPAVAEPTYSREVARIMQAKCQRCHRPNDIAPFPLTNYSEVSEFVDDIRHAVEDGHMPPWKPVPGHGEFRDSFGLTDEERQTILLWAAAGGPEGDPADLPEPLPEAGEWQLGDPDHVIRMPEEFTAKRGRDTYRCFVLPTGLDEDKYLTAVQVIPGNKRIVHHVLLFVDATGAADKLDAADPAPGYDCFGGLGIDIGMGLTDFDAASVIGGWVPGMRTESLPEGVGIKLSKRARVIMQVHYFGGSQGGDDQTRAGLYFSKTPVERRMFYLPLVNTTFKIPAGETAYEVKAALPIPLFLDAKLIQIAPHMHLLGKKIKVELQRGSDIQSLIRIDDWDFHWQGFYTYQQEVPLRSGSTIRLTCTYDNSENNPENPNAPPKVVGWGEGTQDEMCLAYMGVTFDFAALLGLR